MKTISLVFIGLLFPWLVLAHGVHDDGGAKPQKGGVLKSLESIHLELVQMGEEIRVYVYNKESPPKSEDVSKYPVTAKVVLPRNKGSKELKLNPKKDHWSTTYNAKGIHRFDFVLNIEQAGHKDEVVFTIEPKK